ncbi:hypothetical protein L198_08169 [Cryptococcus wingfieldii CBS 7118]|uniref:Uncharacterized protein n=1 Tax=Cryptococcus wingfieldii CBS 7118 TaxID=1295528 RepID=A0A1E3HF45_9TREE|nr:hypothetical protein L198_08169 [Cryptococcus wingfieldii CBS 7118]ODN74983.1 hypothetical protein L198_08169 [Cryptococcus wingfieldii CBS 7118]
MSQPQTPPQSQEQLQLPTYPPPPHESSHHPSSSPSHSPSSPTHSPSSPSPSPSSSSPSESPQQEQQLEQQEQPQAHAGWQRTDLGLQLAVSFLFALHAIFLGAGLVMTWKGRTVPGGRVYNNAGPGFGIIGALLSFPPLIAACRKVQGTESTALGWLAVATAALVLGIVSTVGNMVFSSLGHG